MSKNIAVVSANGLGDGLIALVLSHNLQLNGYKVTTYNKPLCQLKSWFPTHTLEPSPNSENVLGLIERYDHIYAFDHSVARHLQADNVTILKESETQKELTWVENIKNYCLCKLKLEIVTEENGLVPPSNLQYKKHPQRIVIHPTSTELKRDWLPHKFIEVALELKKNGFEPVICVGPVERLFWQEITPQDILSAPFETLADTASFIYESGYLIGVNSGLGHLASNLGIPTLSLFARASYSKLWRPAWANNRVVTPPAFLIGSKLKHRFWKKFLTVSRVLKNFKTHFKSTQK